MYTLNALCIGYCDPISDAKKTRIIYTLNAYCAQDIVTRRQYRQKAQIPHTPKCMLCTVASRPDYVYTYTIPKVAGHRPCRQPWYYYTNNLVLADQSILLFSPRLRPACSAKPLNPGNGPPRWPCKWPTHHILLCWHWLCAKPYATASSSSSYLSRNGFYKTHP